MYKPTTPCIATRRQLVDLLLSAQESSAFLWRHASCLARNNATPLQNITTHEYQHGGIYSGGSHLKSFVWKSFGFYKRGGRLDKMRAICRLCRTVVPYKSATTNLKTHLQRRHIIEQPQQLDGDESKNNAKDDTAFRQYFQTERPHNSCCIEWCVKCTVLELYCAWNVL